MTREIEHERRVPLLRQRAVFHDLDAAVAQEHSGAPRQPARFRRIQDLHANAHAFRRANFSRAK